ncbi:hypothetical protein N781_14220 [Pontibacillus halophilus JSM 076056 = DSM 19796]|uniref:Uncharacterized protein n=1 Tax=Pontibacillus halophilus JSM 076056 = DSM 19796 TaxID=1385510 RepID=A0A0A5GM81_9BACI|nr:hypothetical protein N781_14220 [Pontibacillus halophilus JSM 076056 = DSM 19796]
MLIEVAENALGHLISMLFEIPLSYDLDILKSHECYNEHYFVNVR